MASYRFVEWQDELGTVIATTSSMNLLVEADTTIVAVYEEFIPPPPCFIATATYGTPLAPQLKVLRQFRNRCLPTSIVQLYYLTSPPIAEYIRRHYNVRRIVRSVILEPLIKTIRKLFND